MKIARLQTKKGHHQILRKTMPMKNTIKIL